VFDRARCVAHTEFVETTSWVATVGGGLLLAIIGFALYSLVGMVGSRLDDLGTRINAVGAHINTRFDDVNRRIDDLGGRVDNLDSRLNAVEANLAATYKDVGEILGWVRAHGPIGGTHDPIAGTG
jgi:hypothetical protein